MKQEYFLILVLSFFLFEGRAQIMVRGVVTEKHEGPYPGANVVIKGTNEGTTTDLDGQFEIIVPDSNSVLIFSGVGLVTKEVDLSKEDISDLIHIAIKVECIVDFFYGRNISFFYFGGIRNTPIGGLVSTTYSLGNPALRLDVGYQHGKFNQSQLLAELSFLELYYTCDLNLDLVAQRREINTKEFQFKYHSVFGRAEMNFRHAIELGVARSFRSANEDLKNQQENGFMAGYQLTLRPGYKLNFNTIKWHDNLQWGFGAAGGYRSITFAANYIKVQDYGEINLQVGIKLFDLYGKRVERD